MNERTHVHDDETNVGEKRPLPANSPWTKTGRRSTRKRVELRRMVVSVSSARCQSVVRPSEIFGDRRLD